MLGTIVNAAAVMVAGAVGMAVRKHIPARMTDIVFQAVGLFTMVLGVKMALETQSMVLAVVSLVLGALAGQWMDIEGALERFSAWLQRVTGSGGQEGFVQGFVTATLLFCVGSMTILGAIEDGMGNTPTLLYTKSIMDAASAMILAAALGVGVIFSVVAMLVYQGGLTLLAGLMMRFMSDQMMADMTGVGGVLILGLGFNLLKVKKISVANLLPALVFIVVLSYFF